MKKEISGAIHDISVHPGRRLDIFRQIPVRDRGYLLLKLTPRIQGDIISRLSREELIEALEILDPDEVTSIIRPLSPKKRESIIDELTENIRETVSLLLKFDPSTAGGLMSLDYIQVDISESMGDVVKQFRFHEKRTGKLPLIISMNGGRMVGYIPGHVLGLVSIRDKAQKYTHNIRTVKASAPHREVISVFREHPHDRIVVIGERGNILGVIYSDDVLRVLHDRETNSLYEFAGVSKQEQVLDPAWIKIKFRYRWLILNLGTAFLAAFTVGLFDETISQYVLLAVYMPVVAGMGGNAATQTLAVVVRGISMGQIKFSNIWRVMRNEVLSGMVNGLINGVIVAGIIMALGQGAKLALVLGMAMVFNLMIAGFFGTVVPLLMQKMGKDPASSATIFITTATDVLGFLTFLGLATLILL